MSAGDTSASAGRASALMASRISDGADDVHELRPFQAQRRRLLESHDLETLAVHRRVAPLIEKQKPPRSPGNPAAAGCCFSIAPALLRPKGSSAGFRKNASCAGESFSFFPKAGPSPSRQPCPHGYADDVCSNSVTGPTPARM
jgi:hypothetical protein